jgi:hypothetical protein
MLECKTWPQVPLLNDKDARKLGVIDYEETGLGGIPVVSDKAIQQLDGSTVYDLDNQQDLSRPIVQSTISEWSSREFKSLASRYKTFSS